MCIVEIRRFDVLDVEDYRTIRLAALSEAPEAFGSTFEIEVARPVAAFADRLTTSIVFGAYVGGHIVGMISFRQEVGQKNCHKGFVWGMYVRPDARRQGVGTALIEALLQSTREIVEHLTLRVAQGNVAAIALYRNFGFQVYGVEPRALKSCLGYFDDVLMVRLPSLPRTEISN
ncbi:MAG: GNAT family N-acetyltransferase [Methylocella sp.]